MVRQNILAFTPPGFTQQLSVKFPDSRLAVCQKCKKNFKTRDMCRVRSAHTEEPWTTAYVCITIDESCLDENGRYVDKPLTVRMVQWQPYCVFKPFHRKTPVCAACKRTNRTRNFCRDRHKHRALPWCTVYVLLSALDAADPSTIVAGASKKVNGGKEKNNGAGEDSPPGDDSSKATDANNTTAGDDIDGDDDPGDNIHEIAESRTFLAKVSCRATSIHWLELAEYDAVEGSVANLAPPPPVPEPQYQLAMGGMDQNHVVGGYYQPSMNYAAQQHQNALKSRQRYFFQMQQQQQQYLMAGSVPRGSLPSQWAHAIPQQPYQMGSSGHLEPDSGDGIVNGKRDETAKLQPQQLHNTPMMQHEQWASMYYPAPPPAYGDPHTQHEANGQGPSQHLAADSDHALNGEANLKTDNDHHRRRSDDDELDNEEQSGGEIKKQRVI